MSFVLGIGQGPSLDAGAMEKALGTSRRYYKSLSLCRSQSSPLLNGQNKALFLTPLEAGVDTVT